MSKRFTDTGLNRQPWFRKMNTKMKCAVRFLFDECDVAGVWNIDMETMSYFVGEEVTLKELFENINSDKSNRIEKFRGDKIFIPGFIEFQYGELSEKCAPHKPIIKKLKNYDLYERVLKGYLKGSETLEEKDKYKEKEEEEEKDKGGMGGNFIVPSMQKIFKEHIPTYLPDKEKDYRPLLSIANFLCQQANVRGGPENHHEKIIQAWIPICAYLSTDKFYSQKSLSTISNHIQEIIQKAIHGDKSSAGSKANGQPISKDKLGNALASRLR